MNFFLQILILGLVQGAAELLPVSSSAHVIVVEKLMGLDPSSPEMTFLLVMLHTGTMFAVIVYFWKSWIEHYCSDAAHLEDAAKNIAAATAVTIVIGLMLQWIIEKVVLHGQPKAEVEVLFSQLPLIGGALLAAGLLIIISGMTEERHSGAGGIKRREALLIGAVQGLCLPFRGFSRSGGTISTGLLLGIEKRRIEEFSFALAVVLTPIVVVRELWRLIKAHPEMTHGGALVKLLTPGFLGMACSFVAGYLALKLLSSLLEAGRWKYFGYYCFVAAAVVFGLAHAEAGLALETGSSSLSPAPLTNADAISSLVNPPAALPATNTDSPSGAPAAMSTTPEATASTNAGPLQNTTMPAESAPTAPPVPAPATPPATNPAPANVPAPQ